MYYTMCHTFYSICRVFLLRKQCSITGLDQTIQMDQKESKIIYVKWTHAGVAKKCVFVATEKVPHQANAQLVAD